MKRTKKIKIIIMLVFIISMMIMPNAIATDIADSLSNLEYTDEFEEWIELTDEEKENTIQPRAFSVANSSIEYINPIYFLRMLKSSLSSSFSLKDVISENLTIRNQEDTNSCWAFAAISSLETNLALTDNTKIYDYSERHMEYATSNVFLNDGVNLIGYNRQVGSGGNWCNAESYLTSGYGAIDEEEMEFENNEDIIDVSEIQNKTVTSEVYDTIYFEDYSEASDDEEKEEIMNQIKQHIQNYGSVFATIHGSSSSTTGYTCYNNDTGAKYCNDSTSHSVDHGVSIIGWDDNYSVDNFAENNKPSSDGAWIVRNSWGEREEFDLLELKQAIYDAYTSECNSAGWTDASLIPDSFIEKCGYTIEGDIAYVEIGDGGLIYVSYEDVNVASSLCGIVKANDSVDYDNIYQYNIYYAAGAIRYSDSEIMLANIFERDTTDSEYITQIGINTLQTYTCRVYLNPSSSSLSASDLQLVELKAGKSETIDSGYHTLEFATPIEITGDEFAVVVEITTDTSSTTIPLESLIDGAEMWDSVTVETEKCFLAGGHDLENCDWIDLGKLSEISSSLVDGDSTIKVFTTNKLYDESLESIEITTPPDKTSYYEGEDFDSTGMVVTAYYNSKTNPSVVLDSSDYSISNATSLKSGQTNVTITYGGKSVTQTITVEENSVVNLTIKTPPDKTTYKEGENFDDTGMVIEATRKNGDVETVTDYTIEDGANLIYGQTTVTISYEDITVEQKITVTSNPLVELKIGTEPDKTNYVVGQNFDATGMVVLGIYQDETTTEIENYTIKNGTNLTADQTYVTISYLEFTVTQAITVEEKAITGISISQKPTKLEYIQNEEELDLSGGVITVTYNDETTENILMDSSDITVSGFSNENVGTITITLEYQSFTLELEVEIVEETTDDAAENSNFDNITGSVAKIKAYYYTDNSQEDYVLLEIEIDDIVKSTSYDSLVYYYYLSTSSSETNITDWVLITETQTSDGKLIFTINSEDLANYDEISKENVLYLYIKEVATKGANQSVYVSSAIELSNDTTIEMYVNNSLEENINYGSSATEDGNSLQNETEDNTTATGTIPQTGEKVAFAFATGIIIIAIIFYAKYRKYKDCN